MTRDRNALEPYCVRNEMSRDQNYATKMEGLKRRSRNVWTEMVGPKHAASYKNYFVFRLKSMKYNHFANFMPLPQDCFFDCSSKIIKTNKCKSKMASVIRYWNLKNFKYLNSKINIKNYFQWKYYEINRKWKNLNFCNHFLQIISIS